MSVPAEAAGMTFGKCFALLARAADRPKRGRPPVARV